jgi:alginate O-acetyltransferase complex protein AlgJ
VRAARSPGDFWELIPKAEHIKAAEKDLEKLSVIAKALRPRVQGVLTGMLHSGTEQAFVGRDGWLFYRSDVEYVTGPAFLDPARLRQRAHDAHVQPDPVKGIVHFRDQLAKRGIELIVMPMPVKPCIEGEKLGARAGTALHNVSHAEFLALLAAAKVRVFDPTPLLMSRKPAPQYLETDTHWRPDAMEFIAQKLAVEIQSGAAAESPVAEKQIAALGDIAGLLGLPESQQYFRPQTVTIHQVPAGTGLWRPSADAGVLLLGDSFANIFSLEAMGWGEAAGFAEHLSRALGKPLDCILRNSDGSFATREQLQRELALGRDRLAGKKIVVWEFAARELSIGDWKLLPLDLGTPPPSKFFTPEPGHEKTITGTVAAISSVPRPGTVPYAEHILTAHLVDLDGADATQALVCTWSMSAQKWTSAARLRPGDRVKLKVRAWSDVSAQYEKINRSELSDAALQLEEPVWGEIVER